MCSKRWICIIIPRVRLLAAIASVALGLVSSIAAPGATTVLAHSGAFETVATGLDNPRGLVPLGEDRLAVAEAGHAGPCVHWARPLPRPEWTGDISGARR